MALSGIGHDSGRCDSAINVPGEQTDRMDRERIFELVEAPVDRAGFDTCFCRRGCFPKLVAKTHNAHVASGVPVELDTDRR